MSDSYLHLVPCDPEFVPDASCVAEAVKLLASFLPNADDVSVRQSEEIRFIDQGESFDGALPKLRFRPNGALGRVDG
jgi:hypothetical protein